MSAITDKFQALLASGFNCGSPMGPEIPIADGGAFQTYDSGVTIFASPSGDAHEVHGLILQTYLLNQGALGQLGFPVSDEYDNTESGVNYGRISDFERGSIMFYFATGQTVVMQVGPISSTSDFEIIDGIDVSVHQGVINWAQVGGSGIQFAYVKASEGDTVVDGKFADNWTNASGHVLRGAYHFFHPRADPNATTAQTDNFVAVLNRTGDIGELPPMVDIEVLDTVSTGAAIASLQRFLKDVEQAFGRRPIIYTFPSFWEVQMNNTDAFAGDYHLWIANYGSQRADGGFDRRRTNPIVPGRWPNFRIWQFGVLPGVPGITTLVDRDTAFVPSDTDLASFLGH